MKKHAAIYFWLIPPLGISSHTVRVLFVIIGVVSLMFWLSDAARESWLSCADCFQRGIFFFFPTPIVLSYHCCDFCLGSDNGLIPHAMLGSAGGVLPSGSCGFQLSTGKVTTGAKGGTNFIEENLSASRLFFILSYSCLYHGTLLHCGGHGFTAFFAVLPPAPQRHVLFGSKN